MTVVCSVLGEDLVFNWSHLLWLL